MMGDEVLAETLMRMFVANTPGDIERLRVAVEQGDLAAARAAAHHQGGRGQYVRAGTLAHKIERDEDLGRVPYLQ